MHVRDLALMAVVFLATALPAGAARTIRDNDLVALPGNTPVFARPELDIGPLDGAVPFERMVLVLKRRAGTDDDLRQLLEAQQNPSSPLYHQWLMPEEFGARFGPTDSDLKDVEAWLQRSGFTVDEVANGRGWINFSGTVADVERVFNTQIRQYRVDGQVLHANASDPQIPRDFVGVIQGIASLNNNFSRPLHHVVERKKEPQYGTGTHSLAPSDFATIYNVSPLYSAGYDGTGQAIAVVGRTDININDVRTFRSFFGLPAKDPLFIHNGSAPGINADEGEADLDVEWSGAVGRNTTIDFVISASTQSSDGVALSSQYIVNHNLAPVITISYGQCEDVMSSSDLAFWGNTWAQAAAQGITVFVSSGDSGASGCDFGGSSFGSFAAVSGLCTSPYDVCVGGSEFLDSASPGAYWSSGGNALSYIPESAWNESGAVSGGDGLWSTGGGASFVYGKPSWQSCPGVPNDGARDVPDLSLTAAQHDGYNVVQEGFLEVFGGTSASAPSMAGIMSLLVQKTGAWQGNANPTFYTLARNQYNGGTVAFHDVTTGNNSVPGVSGFNCTFGYDQSTGVGTANATALANAWPSSGSGSATELLVDGGFEQATATGNSAPGWTVLPASGHTIIQRNGSYPHSGTNYAFLGGSATASTDILKQTVSIPSNATSVTVSFWVNIVTQEAAGGGSYDQLSAALYNTSGVYLANVASFTNENAVASNNSNGVYFKAGPIDVSAYRGSTVQLVFEADTDSSLSTSFRLDDVSMQVRSSTTTCTSYSLTPSSANPGYQSGSTGVTLTGSPSGCSGTWSASGNGSWITVSPSSGSGSGPVTVSWAQNTSMSPRSGNATIGGATFTVSQGGAPSGVSGFYVLTPCRIIDTRNPVGAYGGPALPAATTRNIGAAGRCGVPSGATSLSVNLTVVAPLAVGWLTLYPGPIGNTRPVVSSINFMNGRTIANNAIVTVAPDGTINVYNGGTSATGFIIDVNGYFK
jgi:hypothetical protein